jgi:hypothetical protein
MPIIEGYPLTLPFCAAFVFLTVPELLVAIIVVVKVGRLGAEAAEGAAFFRFLSLGLPPAISYSVLFLPYFVTNPVNIRSDKSANSFSAAIASLLNCVSDVAATSLPLVISVGFVAAVAICCDPRI